MLLETIGFAVLGLAVGFGAPWALPGRFASLRLVRATSMGAALLGGWVTHSVLGAGHAPITLIASALVSMALATLLLRPRAGAAHARVKAGSTTTPTGLV